MSSGKRALPGIVPDAPIIAQDWCGITPGAAPSGACCSAVTSVAAAPQATGIVRNGPESYRNCAFRRRVWPAVPSRVPPDMGNCVHSGNTKRGSGAMRKFLLGSAAVLVAAGGAQAADLPVKAKPVEYVKVCSLYGAGFWY